MKLNPDHLKQQAISLLKEACCAYGIMASPEDQDNYKRLWARDSMVAGIAGLLAGDEEILSGFEKSIQILARYQHPYGMIPSNVLPDESDPEISYGGLAGRVDATTWFVIGTCLYLFHRKNENLTKTLQPNLLQALEILDRWEFNGKGLLYTPLSGNWADEYPVEGHTLYDNLLRVWGLKLYSALFKDRGRNTQADVILERIAINFWPEKSLADHPAVYHPRNFKETFKKNLTYFACSINPKGHNMHFDAAGHGLALLLDLPTDKQLEHIHNYIKTVFEELGHSLIPAFWPVIHPGDPEWPAIKQNYSFDFKNKPHHFHNGGIWPVWMGLFALGMKKKGNTEIARQCLESWMGIENPGKISFSEYIASDTFKPAGKQNLSYSASGLIFLLEAIEPDKPLMHLVH